MSICVSQGGAGITSAISLFEIGFSKVLVGFVELLIAWAELGAHKLVAVTVDGVVNCFDLF